MVRTDALHSRLVTGLRIALPLVALGLLSTLFLLSREVDPSRALPYAAVDAEDLARDPRITAPRLSSVTADGSALTVTAGTVRIAATGRETTEAEAVTATLVSADRGLQRFEAGHARLVDASGVLELSGGVSMTDTAGHSLTSRRIDIALDRTRVISPGAIAGTGPLGRIEAGAMRIEPAGDATGLYRLRFDGGVRLVHHPEAGDLP